MLKYYNAKFKAYRTLQELQEIHVPQLYTTLTISHSPNSVSRKGGASYANSPAKLMQYINRCPLNELSLHASKGKWQSVCDEAIQIIRLDTSKEILNDNV